jgi:hypothetical protein
MARRNTAVFMLTAGNWQNAERQGCGPLAKCDTAESLLGEVIKQLEWKICRQYVTGVGDR